MANPHARRTLGQMLRDTRVAKGLGLRELARRVNLTPSYVSDIENDRRVPAEDVLRKLGTELDLSFDDLMSKAGKLGDQAERYIKDVPEAVTLFRRISEKQLSPQQLAELRKVADRLDRPRRNG